MTKLIQLEEPETPVGKLLKKLEKLAIEEASFTPTKQMVKAKSRLWSAIHGNPVLSTNLEDMTLDAIVKLSGYPNLLDWADQHPFFFQWLCDEHYERHDLEAMAEKAKRKLVEIMDGPMEPKVLTAKDQLAAANLLLQLADKFPNKRKEIIYADKELGRMSDEEVEREQRKLQKQLRGAAQDAIDVDTE